MRSSCLLAFPVLVVAWTSSAVAADPTWTRFRGPNGSGISETANIPVTWTDRDYRWKVELPGKGFSSPVVWKDRLYLTSCIEDQSALVVLCLKTADGSVAWQRSFKVKPHAKYKANLDACATPAINNDRVYVAWAGAEEHVVVALDRLEGKEIWRRDLGPFVAEDGFGASPVLVGDVVVVTNDQDEGGTSSVEALDQKTGKTQWSVPRESKKAAFSTPCVFEPQGGRAQVVVLSRSHGITSLDPACGKKNWELEAFQMRTTGSPLLAEGILFASEGGGTSGKSLVAVRAGNPERGVQAEVLYRITEAVPYVITPVARWPLVFLWSDRGVVTCIDGPTGKVHWRQRVGGEYLGSPVRVGDRLYCISLKGEMVVLAAGDEFKLLARIDLAEPSNSTPSLADGVMYLRTHSHLMALGER